MMNNYDSYNKTIKTLELLNPFYIKEIKNTNILDKIFKNKYVNVYYYDKLYISNIPFDYGDALIDNLNESYKLGYKECLHSTIKFIKTEKTGEN